VRVSDDGQACPIRGTPKAAGSSSAALTIVDSDGQTVNTTLAFSIARRLRIATTKASPATVGKSYRLRLGTIGGVAPRAWTLARGKLPSSLKLDPNTGPLAGTPRKPGRYPITLRVADKLGATNTRPLTLTVTAS